MYLVFLFFFFRSLSLLLCNVFIGWGVPLDTGVSSRQLLFSPVCTLLYQPHLSWCFVFSAPLCLNFLFFLLHTHFLPVLFHFVNSTFFLSSRFMNFIILIIFLAFLLSCSFHPNILSTIHLSFPFCPLFPPILHPSLAHSFFFSSSFYPPFLCYSIILSCQFYSPFMSILFPFPHSLHLPFLPLSNLLFFSFTKQVPQLQSTLPSHPFPSFYLTSLPASVPYLPLFTSFFPCIDFASL